MPEYGFACDRRALDAPVLGQMAATGDPIHAGKCCFRSYLADCRAIACQPVNETSIGAHSKSVSAENGAFAIYKQASAQVLGDIDRRGSGPIDHGPEAGQMYK